MSTGYVPLAHLRCTPHGRLNCELCKAFEAGGEQLSTADERHDAFWEGTALESAETMRAAGTSYPLYGTQESLDHLAENITSMLDEAMHLEACWISEDETRCVCIISQLRAVLPQCGHVEQVGVKGRTRQCLSTVHPSAPYKHVFGTV